MSKALPKIVHLRLCWTIWAVAPDGKTRMRVADVVNTQDANIFAETLRYRFKKNVFQVKRYRR